jgi:hypothetical protein
MMGNFRGVLIFLISCQVAYDMAVTKISITSMHVGKQYSTSVHRKRLIRWGHAQNIMDAIIVFAIII